MKLSDFELGWLVAFLEGEGYFAFDGGTQRIEATTTDEDIAYRLASILERILEKSVSVDTKYLSRKNVKWQDAYRIGISGNSARIVMRLIVSHMGYRRRQRIWQCLNGFKQKRLTQEELTELIRVVT